MTISKILGVSFNVMSETEALYLFVSHINEGGACKVIVTPNPEAVMRARKDARFANAVYRADYRLADGTGIVLASRLTKTPIKNRLRGYDTAVKLLGSLTRPTTAYFLGCAPGVAEKAAGEMARKYPLLKPVGAHDGYFPAENETVIVEEIKKLKPDILLLGMGMPRQEIFAERNRNLPVKLILCLGGSLDVMAGNVQLAPPVFRKLGLEWLHRLMRQPSRAGRMLALPKFALLVLWRFINPLKSVEENK